MSLLKHSKTGAGQLPKSVKVRSTCNACQQAKIRCSHEKPSCRRCQKHKIECIYSVSRRLGRPAKKKEPFLGLDGEGHSSGREDVDRPQRQKRRKPQKKKSQGVATGPTPASRPSGKTNGEDRVPASIPPEVSTETLPGLEADVASESWLQELISTHVNGNQGNFPVEHPYGDIELDDAFDICPDELVYAVPPFSLEPEEIYSPWIQAGPDKMIPRDLGIFQYTAPGDQVDSVILKENETVPWLCGPGSSFDSDSFLDPWALERVSSVNMLMDPPHCQPFQSPHASQESGSYSPDDPSFLENFETGPSFGCSCYEQAMSELVRCGLKGLSSMDELLNCQKELLLQTENILQCEMCSQSEAQANLLMVIVVTIDSLLTTLDSTASGKCAIDDGVSPVGRKSERERGCSFVSQIDACPLLVGGFRVPMEEKTCFVRQVLQARLSMLLLTIRRIRVCMQQNLTLASSRGRLLMILETDRRLQLIMMKIKMSVG